jgi:hypothetical protein
MNEAPMTGDAADTVEQLLRDDLTRGDVVAADARPILRYLLAHEGHPLFTEATVARVRGMMLDLASQLLHAEAEAGKVRDRSSYVGERQDALAGALIEEGRFLAHAQALVLEADLVERLQARGGIDAVLPLLVQELAAREDETTAALAMALLAAQARFMQQCRRMELPMRELPGDLFHAALMALRARGELGAEAAERRLRAGYDEGASRLGLIARAVTGLGDRSQDALAIDRAGVAIFASALAMASGQERDSVVLSFAEGQFARLLLVMRAAGLEYAAMERQLLFLHPDHRLPDAFDTVSAERAAALLSSAGAERAAP